MQPQAGASGRWQESVLLDGGYDQLPTRKTYQPVFIPLTLAACCVVLLLEFYENGKGEKQGVPTQDCYFQLTVTQHVLLCAADLGHNPLLGPSNAVLVRLGAKDNARLLAGEGWRLVTPMYLHAGLLHLVLNMMVLWQLGMRLEEYHGALRVGAVYLLSGSFGVIMSALLAPRSISVGASGAIFGLMGASLGEILQNWRLYERPCVALCQLGVGAALQLLLGTMPLVDNFAHFFGFCMGLLSSLGFLHAADAGGGQSGSGRIVSLCARQLAKWLALSVTYLVFAAGLLALFGGWDAHRLCPLCSRISCLPFPWGCNPGVPDSCWWDCSLCGSGGLSAQVGWVGSEANGTVTLRCPISSGVSAEAYENVTVRPIDVSTLRSQSLVGLCKSHCPDAFD